MRVYGQWGGNPSGTPEDVTRCVKMVWPSRSGSGFISYQCRRPRGHGKGGLYCRQHAKQHPAESTQTDNQQAWPADARCGRCGGPIENGQCNCTRLINMGGGEL